MKLEDVISNLDKLDDELVIFLHDKIDIDSDVSLFDNKIAGGRTKFIKDEIEYHYLIEVSIAKEVVEGWVTNIGRRPTDKEIAQRVFEYGIYDA